MKNRRNHILTEARKKLNLSQDTLAREINISHQFYSQIESLNNFPSKDIQKKISKYFF